MSTKRHYVLISLMLVPLGSLLLFSFLWLASVVKSEPPREISPMLAQEFFPKTSLAKPPPDTFNIFHPDTSKLFTSGSSISVTVSVTNLVTGDESLLPDRFSLSQNYPNPFNGSTIIEYALTKPVRVKLEVYNVLGQKVATLVDRIQQSGYYSYNWEVTDEASGVYLYRITAGQFQESRKMLILR